MAMVLYIRVISNAYIFCRYENDFGVYFDWCIQPTKNGAMGVFRLNEDYQIGKEG